MEDKLKSRTLIQDGQWLVPIEERPAGWEGYGLKEPEVAPQDLPPVAETEAIEVRPPEERISRMLKSSTHQESISVVALREQLRLKRRRLVEKLAEVDKDLESADIVIGLLSRKDMSG